VEKRCRVGQATDEKIIRRITDEKIIRRMRTACWIPRNTNTASELRNIYCFSTATVVPRTRLNVTLYVHCLCGFFGGGDENRDMRRLTFSQYVTTYLKILIIEFYGVKPNLQKLMK
jgi:hypothetical protein